MIRERDRLAGTPARETALACIDAGIEAAHPRTVVRSAVSVADDELRVADSSYPLATYDEVLVVGGGKAAATVAAELEAILGDAITRGVVVTNHPVETERVTVVEADHPVPTERGIAGADAVLDLLEDASASTLVLAVITGGGSALLPAPVDGVTLADVRAVTEALLDSGADIGEINTVRKHLSRIKGGGLARAASPATVVTVALSDVIGSDPAVIASGPTAPDESTYEAAIAVLDRYGIDPPQRVRDHLDRGADGGVPETPGPDDPIFESVAYHVLADGFTAIDAARDVAADRGYTPIVLSARLRGEAREIGKAIVAVGEEAHASGNPVAPPAVVLAGGETTVTVDGDGTGGPNQELALSGAIELERPLVVAAVDTDGYDGGTDAAGAIVDDRTVDDIDAARASLARNDAYPYLEARSALVRTGRTGTNVNDLHVLVVD